MTDAEIKAALVDRTALLLTIWGEARGEPVEGQIAVANVIRNRVQAGRFGDSYRAVCLAPWQFSCWALGGGEANYHAVLEQARAFVDGRSVGPLLKQCGWIAAGIMDGALQDTTHGSTHYFERSLTPVPKWADGRQPTATIGRHWFFAQVP